MERCKHCKVISYFSPFHVLLEAPWLPCSFGMCWAFPCLRVFLAVLLTAWKSLQPYVWLLLHLFESCSVFSPACSRSLPISSHCFFFSVSTYVVYLFTCILCFYFSVLNCIYTREEFSFCCIYPNIQDLEYYLYFIRHSINIC